MRHRYSKNIPDNKSAKLSKKKDIYTCGETSQILNISQRTLYRYIDDGIIETMDTNPNGTRRSLAFTRKSITSFINKHSKKLTVENRQKEHMLSERQRGKKHRLIIMNM